MNDFLPKDSFINEAKKAKFQPSVVIQILIFVLVFIATSIASSIPVVIATVFQMFNKGMPDITDIDAYTKYVIDIGYSRPILVVTLFATAITTLLVIIYCRCIEKRNFRSMGFVKKRAFLQYIIGMFIGFVMFSASVLICIIQGSLEYKGFIAKGNVLFIVLFFIGFLIQGMEEEVLLRGYFMTSISTKVPVVAAIMINSVFFAMLHLMNSGISVIAFINLILFGVFASVYAIKTNSLWGACALHSIWNFVQGNFYGILVSGLDTKTSVFRFVSVKDGELFNGGEFGLEGGIAVTFVLIISTLLTLLLLGNKKSYETEKEPAELNT